VEPGALIGAAVAFAVAVVLYRTWRRKRQEREERYDLRRLLEPSFEPEEPREDTIPEGDAGAPYCGWCDEAYPPGTYRCRQCGRDL
jgi:hypothetical protein